MRCRINLARSEISAFTSVTLGNEVSGNDVDELTYSKECQFAGNAGKANWRGTRSHFRQGGGQGLALRFVRKTRRKIRGHLNLHHARLADPMTDCPTNGSPKTDRLKRIAQRFIVATG